MARKYPDLDNKGYIFRTNKIIEDIPSEVQKCKDRGFEVEVRATTFDGFGIELPGYKAIFVKEK